jgi:hypothetical protein
MNLATRPEDLPGSMPRLADGVISTRTDQGLLRLRTAGHQISVWRQALAWLIPVPRPSEVELDDIGSFVVERMDGRCLATLVLDVASHLQLTRREAEVAVGDFMLLLLRRRLAVIATQDPQAVAEPATGDA